MWLHCSIEVIMTYPWVKKDTFTYERKEIAGVTSVLLNYHINQTTTWWIHIFTYLWVVLDL